MWYGFGILGAVLWICVAIWPARIAAQKGRSFFLWFILSLFFWWITLFVAYSLKDNSRSAPAPAAE
jgi:hypothetical protein